MAQNLHGYFCYGAYGTAPIRTIDYYCFAETETASLEQFRNFITGVLGSVPDDIVLVSRDIQPIVRRTKMDG